MKIHALKYIFMATLGLAMAAPALAANEESVLISGKLVDQKGSTAMSINVFAVNGIPSHIERTETISYLDKRSISKDGETIVLAPAQFKTGITLDLTPFKINDGVQLVTLEGKYVKFLGFQKFKELPGAQKPMYSTTEFKSTVRVVDGKVELPVGACGMTDGKYTDCEYMLTINVKKV